MQEKVFSLNGLDLVSASKSNTKRGSSALTTYFSLYRNSANWYPVWNDDVIDDVRRMATLSGAERMHLLNYWWNAPEKQICAIWWNAATRYRLACWSNKIHQYTDYTKYWVWHIKNGSVNSTRWIQDKSE